MLVSIIHGFRKEKAHHAQTKAGNSGHYGEEQKPVVSGFLVAEYREEPVDDTGKTKRTKLGKDQGNGCEQVNQSDLCSAEKLGHYDPHVDVADHDSQVGPYSAFNRLPDNYSHNQRSKL